MASPTVSVLVTSARSGRGPAGCLESLKAQTYPHDRFTVQVNGSVEASDAEYVALVSDVVQMDPGWLQALVSAAESHGAAAAAGTILESDRRSVHFAGRDLSFVGLPSEPSGRERLLYANRQAALVRRTAFIQARGFDLAFDDGVEDVDLGWRLNLLGHTVVLAADALAYRASEESLPEGAIARRQRLVERNALAMIFRNYEDRTLERVFPAALALSLFRGLIGSGIDSLALELSSTPAEIVHVSPRLIAHLIGLEDFTRQLPSLKLQRKAIQERRRREDADILPLFGNALHLDGDSRYQELGKALIRDFAIDEIFEPRRHRGARTTLADHSGSLVEVPYRAPATTAPSPKVSVVILTAIGPTHLPECLESLRKQTYLPIASKSSSWTTAPRRTRPRKPCAAIQVLASYSTAQISASHVATTWVPSRPPGTTSCS